MKWRLSKGNLWTVDTEHNIQIGIVGKKYSHPRSPLFSDIVIITCSCLAINV